MLESIHHSTFAIISVRITSQITRFQESCNFRCLEARQPCFSMDIMVGQLTEVLYTCKTERYNVQRNTTVTCLPASLIHSSPLGYPHLADAARTPPTTLPSGLGPGGTTLEISRT